MTFKSPLVTSNYLVLSLYLYFLAIQIQLRKIFKDWEIDFVNAPLLISYFLFVSEIYKHTLNPNLLDYKSYKQIPFFAYQNQIVQIGYQKELNKTQVLTTIPAIDLIPQKLGSSFSSQKNSRRHSLKVTSRLIEVKKSNFKLYFHKIPRRFNKRLSFYLDFYRPVKSRRYSAVKNWNFELFYANSYWLNSSQLYQFSFSDYSPVFVKQIDSFPVNFYLKPYHQPSFNSLVIFQFTNKNMIVDDYILSHSHFQKHNNIFVKSSIRPFVDQYEPLSTRSYLIFLQIGFVFLFGIIISNLYKDYGKEILSFSIDFLYIAGILKDKQWVKQELNLDTERTDFRSIQQVNSKLDQIAGIDNLMFEVSEMIWFLRNKKQRIFNPFSRFGVKNKFRLYQSFLLLGPPGTGKTILVQAIAGEAGVPILVQSGSILKNPDKVGKGAQTLQLLFERARLLSPCIVFIDEIDGVGARRENISVNTTGKYDLMELLDPNLIPYITPEWPDIMRPNKESLNPWAEREAMELKEQEQSFRLDRTPIPGQVLQDNQLSSISRNEHLSVLTQLLIELDGLKSLQNMIVIGATNRRSVLDPALLRPGRFNRLLYLSLPNAKKRIELFKLCLPKVGFDESILWNYLSKRTEGLSAAAIDSIINESALIAINQDTCHTLSTLEQGIIRITTLPNQINMQPIFRENQCIQHTYQQIYQKFWSHSNTRSSYNFNLTPFVSQQYLFYLVDQAYYSTGKNVFSILFETMPSSCLLSLFERPIHFVYSQSNNLIENLQNRFNTRIQLENQLMFLSVGKATQMLNSSIPLLRHYSLNEVNETNMFHLYELTNFGYQDFSRAHTIIRYMVTKWYLYAEQIVTEKYHQTRFNEDLYEFDDDQLSLLQTISEEIQFEIFKNNKNFNQNQQWSIRTWWQRLVQQQSNFMEFGQLQWYRLYMADPEETEQNIEWVPADVYYQALLKQELNPYFYWNEILLSTQDYIRTNLVLNTFNYSFKIIRNSVELVDLIMDYLLRYGSLRDDELTTIVKTFLSLQYFDVEFQHDNLEPTEPLVVRRSWGKNSRRKTSKFIFMQKIRDLQRELFLELENAQETTSEDEPEDELEDELETTSEDELETTSEDELETTSEDEPEDELEDELETTSEDELETTSEDEQ
uniref:Cell division protein FTSH n=1 Tax=Pedobesia claviformis TaxID=2364088 RepID=A0A386B0P3_9CHLO|nr:Cell division protein FTSH [Pedobesia claviformis]AYC65268.1 Cell division protein FTSH [Pedobesia claviformis]